MSEWIKYDGKDEQIAEIKNCKDGYIKRFSGGMESMILDADDPINFMEVPTHYLICNPHPLKEMIIRQAQTGQPVWCRAAGSKSKGTETNKVDWDDYRYEYSFTPFQTDESV